MRLTKAREGLGVQTFNRQSSKGRAKRRKGQVERKGRKGKVREERRKKRGYLQ